MIDVRTLRRLASTVAFIGVSWVAALAQAPRPAPPPPAAEAAAPWAGLDGLRFRAVGPAIMAGRIHDLAVHEPNPAIFYVGTATGGLWKTVNGGTTWQVLFTDRPEVAAAIGDIAIGPRDPNLVWVGTGENNNRQSSSWGNGVYRSTDGGRTFQHMGLAETRHIGRIVIDPVDHHVVYVAATGHLWGPNPERGVFKTTDGGRTWTKVLFVNEDTGATELVMDPANRLVLYAATYQRRRAAWGFSGGGPGSGIHKSVDGGATWTRLEGGLPQGPIGRIGMDVFRANPRILYARVEHATRGGVYRTEDAGATWQRMSDENPRPMYFSQIRIDPTNDLRLYMLGVALHISDDGGRTWHQNRSATQAGLWQPPASPMNASMHSDHHAFWIDPSNPLHVMTGGDGGVGVSRDGGLTWTMLDNMDIGQFYHVGFDMAVPYTLFGGLQDNLSFAGPSATRSLMGIANGDWFLIGGGDGFASFGDPQDPNTLYTTAQDGAAVRVDRRTNERVSIRPVPPAGQPRYRFNWNTPFFLSAHDARTLYIAAERVFRSRDRGQTWEAISGDLTTNADRETLSLMGVAAKDFTLARHDGVSTWPTLTTVAESPRQAAVLYAGSDDGRVHVTRDGGATWTDVSGRFPGLPAMSYAARLAPSAHVDGRVYAAFDNHRSNDYGTWVYASEDFGATWRRLAADLPAGQVVRHVHEDLRNPALLYLGTESGLFVSLDRGARWQRWKANLPTVPIYWIAQHPRDNDLILATHGRSLWIFDDLTPLQQAAGGAGQPTTLFDTRPARQFIGANDKWWMSGDFRFWAPNPPLGATFTYRLASEARDVALRVSDAAGTVVRELGGDGVPRGAGLHRVTWDLRDAPLPPRKDAPAPAAATAPLGAPQVRSHTFLQVQRPEADPRSAPLVLPGTYQAALVVDGTTVVTRPVVVEADWLVSIGDADRRAWRDTTLRVHELQREAGRLADAVFDASRELELLRQLAETRGQAGAARDEVEAASGRLASLRRELGVTVAGVRTPPAGPGVPTLNGRLTQLKTQLLGATNRPTADQSRQVTELASAVETVGRDVAAVTGTLLPALRQRTGGAPTAAAGAR